MTLKDFFDNPEEIFIGACLQFPIYFIVKWWAIPIMILCGLLWRLGGVTGGIKLARGIGVPFLICFSSLLAGVHWPILLAIPFMQWLTPVSYGETGWLYKWLKSDLPVRLICYGWYWMVFLIAFLVSRV